MREFEIYTLINVRQTAKELQVFRYEHREQQVRRIRVAGVAAAVTVLAALAYTAGVLSRPDGDGPAQAGAEQVPPAAVQTDGQAGTSNDRQPTGPVPPAEPSADPLESGIAWLRAYRTVHFADAAATAWVDRVRPVATARMRAEYERYRDGSVGADWEEFVSGRCVTSVENVGGVIPEEAPRTASTVNVQVAGSVHTRCAEAVRVMPAEEVAATLQLVRGSDGRWRVSRRLR